MEAKSKDELIRRFAEYLDNSGGGPGGHGVHAGFTDDSTDGRVYADLYLVLTELASLKNEVREETRTFKGALDHANVLLDTVSSSNAVLREELERKRLDIENARIDALKPVLTDIVEIRDGMESALRAAEAYQPAGMSKLIGGEQVMVEAMRERQRLMLRQMDRSLDSWGVGEIHAAGERFNSFSMREVETVCDQALEDEMVTGEVRKGYIWNGTIIRAAEVVVNRLGR
ncbi:MAG: nucleotide exchange factor GrpE [Nitrospirae bacterium]|nr:nucleotide exchange factor GrpE [Nitrospirota bacterium]